jgi:hypothetical protein
MLSVNTTAAKRWPDFLVIGAAKAGTTALYKAVCRHPRAYLPTIKEPSYLNFPDIQPSFRGPGSERANRYIISTRNQYLDLYKDCPSELLAGDFSTGYLDGRQAPASAKTLLPNAPIIAILRHPVDRAYSMYQHFVHINREPCPSFEEAFADSDRRMSAQWRNDMIYREPGFYGRHIKRWLDHFPRQQLLILFYEDWRDRPDEALMKVWHHLGLDPLENPRVTRENISSRQPRWAWLYHRMVDHENPVRRLAQRTLPLWVRDAVTTAVGTFNLRPGPRLEPNLRARLAVTYHDDISQLEALTGRDLIAWRS